MHKLSQNYKLILPAFLVCILMFSIVFSQDTGKMVPKAIEAELSANYTRDEYGNVFAELNTWTMPIDNTSYHTTRIKWDGMLFDLKDHRLISKESQLLEIIEGESEIVVYLPPGASMNLNVVLEVKAKIAETTNFELEIISSSPGDEGVVNEPELIMLHKEFILTKPSLANNSSSLPVEYALRQNHPNPFNPATMIEYDLPRDCRVSIKVFDVLGKEVNSLIDSEMPAGFHKITWDGSNSDGNHVASGIYFIKMKTPEVEEVIKTQLIK